MALIRDFDISGITASGAYFVITGLNAQKRLLDVTPEVVAQPDASPPVVGVPASSTPSNKWDCNIVVAVFKDKARRDAGDTPIAYMSDVTPSNPFKTAFEYDPTGTLPIVQGYAFLMSQPYFSAATVDTTS